MQFYRERIFLSHLVQTNI